jgi:hypothetical protein
MNDDRNRTASDECNDIRENFSALLDSELSSEEREHVENHLAQCSECLRALDGLQRVDGLYRALPEIDAPDRLANAVREALRPKERPRNWFERLPRVRLVEAAVVLLVVGGLATMVGVRVDAPVRVAKLEPASSAVAESTEEKRSDSKEDFDLAPIPEAEMVADQAFTDDAPALGEAAEDSFDKGVRTESPAPAPAKPSRRQTPQAPKAKAIRAPQEAAIAKIAPRVFEERDGIHYEVGYESQELTRITRDTAAFETLLEGHAVAREDIARHDRIVIRLGETWYLVEPAADSEESV